MEAEEEERRRDTFKHYVDLTRVNTAYCTCYGNFKYFYTNENTEIGKSVPTCCFKLQVPVLLLVFLATNEFTYVVVERKKQLKLLSSNTMKNFET